MLTSKLSQTYLLTGLYAVFGIFVFATFDRSLEAEFYLIVLVCFAAACMAIQRSRVVLMHYVNLLALSAFMYSIQRELGQQYILFQTNNTLVTEKAMAIVISHVVLVALGATLARSQHGETGPAPRSIGTGAAFVAFIVLSSLIIAIALFIGLHFFTQTRIDRVIAGIEITTTNRIFEFLAKSILYVLMVAMILMGPRPRRAPLYWLLVLLVAFSALTISNPINTPRFISLSGITLVGIAAFFRIGLRRSLGSIIILMPLMLILALPLTSVMRRGTDLLAFETAYDMFTSLEFSSFQLLLDAVGYFSNKDLFSAHTLSAIFIMVPRFIWTGKETGIGNEVAGAKSYVIENVSLPSFFNFFADYGYVGLILGSLAMGWLFARLEIAQVSNLNFRNRRHMYGLIILCLAPIIARGDMSTACTATYAFLASYEIVRQILRLGFGVANHAATPANPVKPRGNP